MKKLLKKLLNGLNLTKKLKKKNLKRNKRKSMIFIHLLSLEYTEKLEDPQGPEVWVPVECQVECRKVLTPLNSLNKLKEDNKELDKDPLLTMSIESES